METYWNHNTAFHNELVESVKMRGGRVLDIGCGDGLLLQRIAPFAQRVVGIDPDSEAIKRAQTRLAGVSNVSPVSDDFLAMPVPSQEDRYSTIICVATLHHMELRSALSNMDHFLAPGGRLLVVGLAADKSMMDKVISGLLVLPIRLMDLLHGGMQDPAVRIAEPKESLSEIRQAASEVLPGAKVRRRFYFRYVMIWDKPRVEQAIQL
ncbi:class I SAM-dependent methyltransferase [Paenibacillus roseipurpureus]|uniref:Class I SAM-dependent methyltransferase n=1 Tax=Paenibacillus roseopurpureus TaxID=2918901 RepID=A0AA96LNL4_9BACL|nr:class I SAM-dependent methyltransferase [Paenibacillus sp. MBLB1832]WNR43841.1 class I SAM-dependent methyltransferase [Paenibacillus sp. MBLB1832]